MDNIKNEIEKDIKNAKNLNEINEIKIKYLGKKGVITELQNKIKDAENKKEYGMMVNDVKNYFNDKYEEKFESINTEILNKKLKNEQIDISMPAVSIPIGAPNILEKTTELV